MLKYVGKGKAILGIPARDLSDAEVAFYGGKRYLLATELYAEVKMQKPKHSNKMVDRSRSEDK